MTSFKIRFFIICLDENLCLSKTCLGILMGLDTYITISYLSSAGHSINTGPRDGPEDSGQSFISAILVGIGPTREGRGLILGE